MCKSKESPQGATTRAVTGVGASEQRKSIRKIREGFMVDWSLVWESGSTPEYATWTYRKTPKGKFLGTKVTIEKQKYHCCSGGPTTGGVLFR